MTIKRIVTTILTVLTFLAVASAGAGSAAAEPDLPACQTAPYRSEVVHQWRTGYWGYLYRIIWCVENTTIKWALADVVPVVPDDSDCTWGGTAEETLGSIGDGSWTAFHMGWFSCPDTNRAQNDHPWGVIMVHPDGTSEIPGQGTA